MTDDEHTIRAMLMGYRYIRSMNVYVQPPTKVWLDAVTLEPLTDAEKELRFMVSQVTTKGNNHA